MTLFLDAELNGFGGELISVALVSDRGGEDAEFYGVRYLPADINTWAMEHVIPVLGREPEQDSALKKHLRDFLHLHAGETIVADWPLDFVHFLSLLCEPDGRAYQFSLSMRLVKQCQLVSICPHNALADAIGLMRSFQPDHIA